MADPSKRRLNCVLIAGGKYHDIDFARLELLKLLSDRAAWKAVPHDRFHRRVAFLKRAIVVQKAFRE